METSSHLATTPVSSTTTQGQRDKNSRISRVLHIALLPELIADDGRTEADGVIDAAEAEDDMARLSSS